MTLPSHLAPAVLHGTWSVGRRAFLLWAEGPEPPRARRRANGKLRPHPFALAAEAIAERLGIPGSVATATLSLPTSGGKPLASTPAVGDQHAAELSLADWTVPALLIAPLEALLWLGRTEKREVPEGTDFRFWRAAATFALELLARERWLPQLERTPAGEFEGRAVVALNLPEDAARFRQLVDAMPAACRAERLGAGVPSSRSSLLRGFLDAGADAAVRGWSPPLALVEETSAHAWLRSLTGYAPAVAARPENLRPLSASLRNWLEPLLATGARGYRTCFRLDPPLLESGEEAPWFLSYWLQAVDEPSLLVPADEVWEHSGAVLAALGRQWEQPREGMLAALARAARLFAPIAASLQQKDPEGCELTTQEAYQFLRETAPLLEETGMGVLTPDWWRKAPHRLGVRVRMRTAPSAARGVLTQDRLAEFDWQLAVGDEPLTPEEFRRLAGLKTPLVRLRGRWVEVHPDEVERAIRAWERRRAAGPISLLDALQLAAEQDGELPINGVEFEGELKKLFDRLQGEERPDPVPLPEGFHGVLRPYQQYGLEWLTFLRTWGLGACLADDMGLGKTVQVLAYLLQARLREPQAPSLLVCPTSLVENWRREARKFAPDLRVYIHHGTARIRNLAGSNESSAEGAPDSSFSLPPSSFESAVSGHDLVVTTYPLAARDEEVLRSVGWDTVILDEAQNIKNPCTRQARAVRALSSGRRVAMTGTPVENRLTDLWSLMEFLNPGYLGPERGFRGRFAVPIERDHDPEASERLQRLIRPFILRRVKTDPNVIQDLPDKQEMKVFCSLTSEQATLYEAVVREMLEQLDDAEGIQRKGLVLSTLSRLKQVCNHPAHFLHDDTALEGRSGKLSRLTEMLEEIFAVEEAALVFTQFAEWGERMRAFLEERFGREILFLHGGVPRKQRDEMVHRFQASGGPPVMLLSLKAGGVGLNLTRANHVFHYDRWWNPAVENQATDRAFRIGQTRNVQVHKFICAGTLEDRIDEMIEQKQDLARRIVGTGEGWLTELSTAQLRDLISLRSEAIL